MDNGKEFPNKDSPNKGAQLVPKQDTRSPFTALNQVESDLALARTLQEQERAFMMLERDRNEDEDQNCDSASFVDEDENYEDDDDDDDDYGDGDDEWSDEFHALEQTGESQYLAEDDCNSQDEEQELDSDQFSYEELIALGEVVGTQSRGLSTDGISSLPCSTYKSHMMCDINFDECVICRVDYEEGETLVTLPCKHSYHSDCINKWLQINKVCPICTREVFPSARK